MRGQRLLRPLIFCTLIAGAAQSAMAEGGNTPPNATQSLNGLEPLTLEVPQPGGPPGSTLPLRLMVAKSPERLTKCSGFSAAIGFKEQEPGQSTYAYAAESVILNGASHLFLEKALANAPAYDAAKLQDLRQQVITIRWVAKLSDVLDARDSAGDKLLSHYALDSGSMAYCADTIVAMTNELDGL